MDLQFRTFTPIIHQMNDLTCNTLSINAEEGSAKKKRKKNCKKACSYCRKSHKRCDNQRPCSNCIKYKKECINESKKVSRHKEPSIIQNMLPIITNTLDRVYTLEDLKGIVGPEEKDDTMNDMNQIQRISVIEQNDDMNSLRYGISANNDNNNVNAHTFNYNPNDVNNVDNTSNIFNTIHSIGHEIQKYEEEKHKGEIDEIRLQTLGMNENEIPDPVDLAFLKQHYLNSTFPNIFLPSQGRRAGSMFMIGIFEKNIQPKDFYAKCFKVQNISECFSLSFGRTPPELIGKTYTELSPKYSEETLINKGLELNELLVRDKMNYIRAIDFVESHNGETFAFDCNCAIFCDKSGPVFSYAFIKQIRKLENQLLDYVPRFSLIL